MHAKSCSYCHVCVEDEEEYVPKPKPGSAKRTRGATTTKKRQSAAKRQKKSNAEESASLSEVSQLVLKGPNLSASSSSSSCSEDEFDSLVKNWNTAAIEDPASVRTKGQKRT